MNSLLKYSQAVTLVMNTYKEQGTANRLVILKHLRDDLYMVVPEATFNTGKIKGIACFHDAPYVTGLMTASAFKSLKGLEGDSFYMEFLASLNFLLDFEDAKKYVAFNKMLANGQYSKITEDLLRLRVSPTMAIKLHDMRLETLKLYLLG